MRYSSQGRFRQQVRFLRRQFLQDGDLPFSNVLSEGGIAQALTAIDVCWLDRIYSPLVTLWVFLGQVLSADHSCRAAFARLIAHRISQKESPCSAETGAYCQARKRLPEEFFSNVARQTGCALETDVDRHWLWKRRRVHIYDGSAVSMPDTAENQRDYPQPDTQKPGLGFPLARSRPSFSLSCARNTRSGHLPLCRQGAKRAGAASHLVDDLSPRRRLSRRSPDVHMDGNGDAQTTRCRLRVPLHFAPDSRLSPWKTPGRWRSHRHMAQASKAPSRRSGDLRFTSTVPDDPRMSRPSRAGWLSC